MGYIKFPQDLFVGSHELNRLKTFIVEEGFKKLFAQNSIEYGIFNVSKNGNFTNFRVEQGINQGTIKISDGLAINKGVNLITKKAEDNMSVADNNNWYWIKIKHKYSTSEVGEVSISSNGTLTGVGTKFREVLRGLPGVQSLVKIEGSVFNTGEYFVAEVINDTNAVLQGTFQPETNLKLVTIGSFTPGVSPDPSDKEIFNYDSCSLSFVPEILSGKPPVFIEGGEFYIARVKNNAGNLTIQDVRSRFIYKSKEQYLSLIDQEPNPLIGVEAVKWGHPNETKDRNMLYVAWGFRSQNWSYNPSLNRVTFNSGEGGKYKSTGDFVENDFNGWRLYTEDGSFYIVKSSFKQGSQINIDLDTTDFERFINGSQILLVVPDADGVLIHLRPEEVFEELADETFYYPINIPFAKVPAIAYNDPEGAFIVKYKYKKGIHYSIERLLPSDPVGYYSEESFNSTGSIKPVSDRVRVPYDALESTGFIKVALAGNSYKRIIDQFTQGDAFGINITTLKNADPLINLTPGLSIAEQLYDHSVEPILLEVDHFINLTTKNEDGLSVARDGNSFTLQFEGNINLNGFTLKVVSGYINTGQIGIEVINLDQTFLNRAVDKNARIKFFYDLEKEKWKYFIYNTLTASAAPSGAAGGSLTGSYPSPGIANNTIGTSQIITDAVTNLKLAANAVSTSKIIDSSITASKIATGSVGNIKLADNAVSTLKILNSAITKDKIAANVITFDKVRYNVASSALDSFGLAGLLGTFSNISVTDWDDITRTGLYYLANGSDTTLNRPTNTTSAGYFLALVIDGVSYKVQMAMYVGPGDIYIRRKNGLTWEAWTRNGTQ